METAEACDRTAAPQPSPLPSATPETTRSERSPEERLKVLQEKTNAWKAAVADQLKDAAAKNRTLREELKTAKENGEKELVDLRVQLNREFKERTAMLQEEVAALKDQVTALRKEKAELTSSHVADLQAAEARGREGGHMDLEKERRVDEEAHHAEIGRLTIALEEKDKELSQSQHEISLLSTRLGWLGEQYGELSALISSDTAAASGAVAGQMGGGSESNAGKKESRAGGLALAVTDAAHHQQLESVRADLANKERQALWRLERAKAEHEQDRQQLLREIQTREERLAVLQELQRQSQSELSRSHQRISHAQAEAQRLEQHYAAKVASLSQALATQLERLEEMQQQAMEQGRQLALAKETVASLEEDAASREEAFHALMLSDDDKQLMRNLEAATHAAREEAEDWKIRFYELQQEQRQRRGVAETSQELGTNPLPLRPPQQQSLVEGGAKDDVAQRLLTVENREAQLAAREAQLAERAQALRVAEIKLDGVKKSIAQQASMILTKSGGGSAGGGGSGGTNAGRNGGSAGGSRWSSSLGRPALYFDSLSEEQSWLRWLGQVLRWAVSTRLRTLLLASCVVVVFVVFVQFTTGFK